MRKKRLMSDIHFMRIYMYISLYLPISLKRDLHKTYVSLVFRIECLVFQLIFWGDIPISLIRDMHSMRKKILRETYILCERRETCVLCEGRETYILCERDIHSMRKHRDINSMRRKRDIHSMRWLWLVGTIKL